MLFANVCAGVFFFWYGDGGERWFLGFLASPWCLVHLRGVLALLVISLVCTRLGSQRCASCWTRPVGGARSNLVWDLWFQAVYASFSGTAQSP